MNTTNNTSKLVILGLMTGILLLMAYTPLGYLNIGPLAITFNVIPVAIAAITLGPAGGAAIGAVFGMTSFLQCIGIGGSSAMGAMLFSINPFLAFVQRFVPRMLDGLLLGYIFQFVRRRTDAYMESLMGESPREEEEQLLFAYRESGEHGKKFIRAIAEIEAQWQLIIKMLKQHLWKL